MIEKLAAAELPPPGEGFEATKLTICPEANADAGTTTCKLIVLTYFVCSAVLFRATPVDAIYPVLVKVTVCEGEPATMLPGEMDEMVGAGFTAEVGGVGGGVGFPFGSEPPLQPESKERERIEPTKSRELRSTSPPKKQVLPGNNQ